MELSLFYASTSPVQREVSSCLGEQQVLRVMTGRCSRWVLAGQKEVLGWGQGPWGGATPSHCTGSQRESWGRFSALGEVETLSLSVVLLALL
ncbi:hypothetical protein DPEC_G00075120 [Dallia pectoralis]|uniref:Uncharacterized protein n=1 Tax=Dallia pectoralis TaxID=75939 RepID=A0ACC2H3E5_DALPE|nr:hypothetical protein DPEC_G00075120 [Dallia pectoralis]